MTSLIENKKVYIAGHRGMVGSSLVRRLESEPISELVVRTSSELDLRDQAATNQFFHDERPQVVIFAAAKVGGIYANKTYPAEFIYDNLATASNCIHAAYENGCERLLFLGSTCIYPRMAPQPIPEDSLLTGPLESTNEAYAIAKIAGLKMCQFYRQQYGKLFHSAMPTNLYGPGDNYHPENSHVLPALIRRIHEAKVESSPEVVIWGSGQPRREFLHVDDLAEAMLHLVNLEDPPNLVNVGTGEDIAIQDLARLVAEIVGYEGQVTNDLSKPDGTPVKKTDITMIRNTGWEPTIGLREGIERTYQDFTKEYNLDCLREA